MPHFTDVSSLSRQDLELLALNLLNTSRPTFRPLTVPTLVGQHLIKRQIYQDFAFRISQFAIGSDGFWDDPFNPIPPNPAATALSNEVFRGLVERVDTSTPRSAAVVCRLPPGLIFGGIGEMAAIAEITRSHASVPPLPPELGGHAIVPGFQFFIAISHFAIRPIGADCLDLHRIVITL